MTGLRGGAPPALLLARRFLAESARDRLTAVLLVAVPVVFVGAASARLSEFARLLGGTARAGAVEAGTAAWAAAFLSGVAVYYQIAGSRAADRRLVLAGLPGRTLVAARLGAGLVLATLAVTASLLTLAVTAEVSGRAVAGTAMAAAVYLGLGALVAVLVRDELTGVLLLLFVWVLDVFLGPTMAGADRPGLRLLPTHFVALVVTGAETDHAGAVPDVVPALAWVGLSVLALTAVVARSARAARTAPPVRRPRRTRAAVRAAVRDYRRNVPAWLLLLVVPALFLVVAIGVTPASPVAVEVTTGGVRAVVQASLVDVHGAAMAPVATAFLAGTAGLFVVLGSVQADRRLVLAGFRAREVLAARLTVVGLATAAASAVATATLAATAYDARQWPLVATGVLLVGATYGLIGVALGPFVGRVGGVLLLLALPFLDVGIAQNPMFAAAPPAWGSLLPAHGGMRLLLDATLTGDADQSRAAVLALAWLVAAAVAAVVVFRRVAIGSASGRRTPAGR